MLRIASIFAVVLALAVLSACAGGVRDADRAEMEALPPAQGGPIVERLLPDLEAHPGLTGVRLVDSNVDAFAVRLVSARLATTSLDLQYYIWHDDLTGRLLAAELLRAADRGVRVRVLVDDFDVRSKDAVLRTLDTHPMIDIRVFNPFATAPGPVRTTLEVLWRGARLNRRMHNKAWIADGRLAVVGGRNIGDEYFGAAEERNFSDVDLALAGPAVEQVTAIFDRYWNAPVAVRIGSLDRGKVADGDLDRLRDGLAASTREAAASPYVRDLVESEELSAILNASHGIVWTDDVEVLADRPEKIERADRDAEGTPVLAGLARMFAGARERVRIVSPYFVPGKGGSAGLVRLAEGGIDVEVVTNSLAATDVAAVHGGYSAERKALARGGVELYELKPTGDPESRRLSPLGSSGASLHTKAATVDGQRVFVGSFNLDPRSAWINCEMGVIVGSPVLAAQLDAIIDEHTLPSASWQVSLSPEGRLRWTHEVDGRVEELDREPEAGMGRRFMAFLARVLPVRGQL
jgi:putative cardiolipin synthase